LAELAVPSVRYVIWSNDMSLVALLSKHGKFNIMSRINLFVISLFIYF